MTIDPAVQELLATGTVIPAHPLALTSSRRLDERRQRALTRYYLAAGAGGIAVGVHTTQFAIRDPGIGLLDPVLQLATDEMDRADHSRRVPMLRIGGVCGLTRQAVREAAQLARLRFHAGLLSLSAFTHASDDELLAHCREVAAVIPIMGFYLQPAVGGRTLSYAFWRRFVEIDAVVAIKIAPFNRYQTIDVVRAVADSGRDVPLYTGNDDSIVMDLTTPFRFGRGDESRELRIVGGLLGQWAVWTHRAVQLWRDCRAAAEAESMPARIIRLGAEVTDANAALFDASHQFAGCIAGLHEVLRRQGLFEGIWCLDPSETLSPGQMEEIDRVCGAYPHLQDDHFVLERRDEWLTP
jgi:dihydrodipicolinate synthase/N-acetylneuraminate lyase